MEAFIQMQMSLLDRLSVPLKRLPNDLIQELIQVSRDQRSLKINRSLLFTNVYGSLPGAMCFRGDHWPQTDYRQLSLWVIHFPQRQVQRNWSVFKS